MKVINWLGLRLQKKEIQALKDSISSEIALRKLCQLLVKSILEQYPWKN